MKTTPDIKSYIKDTHQNILERDSTESGIWAFASDTGSVFVSNEGGWLEYAADKTIGSSEFITGNKNYQVPAGTIAHLDATQASTIKSLANTPIENEDSVGAWNSTDQATFDLQAERASQAPTYLSNGMASGKAGIQFKRTELATSLIHNTHTYTGDFTVMMVLKFEPVWLNGDQYREGYTLEEGVHAGSNKMVGDPVEAIGLFSSEAGFQTSNHSIDSLSIGADILNSHNSSSWSQLRFRQALGGHNSVNLAVKDDWFKAQWNSHTNPNATDDIKQSQVAAGLRDVGLNWGDRMIFTWRYKSAEPNHRGELQVGVAGSSLSKTYDGGDGGYGDFVLRGLRIGSSPLAHAFEGWYTLGEMIVFNDTIDTTNLNNVGDYLSTKWSTPWTDF